MKKPYLLLMLCLLLNVIDILGQKQGNELIDSLKNELSHVSNDTSKILILNELSYNIYGIDPEIGLKYCNEALTLSDKISWKKGKGKSLFNIAIIHWVKSDYAKSIDYYLQSLKIFEELNDKKGVSSNLSGIGAIYADQKDLERSIDYFNRALNIDFIIRDSISIAKNLGNIGIIYYELNDYIKAKEYLEKAYNVNLKMNNLGFAADNLLNLGNIEHKQMNYDKALDYFFQALDLNRILGFKRDIAIDLGKIGSTYLSIAESKKIGTEKSQKINKFILNKAITYLKNSIEMLEKSGDLYYLKEFYLLLSNGYELVGNTEKAFEIFKKHTAIKDSVFSIDNKKKIFQIESKTEIEKRDNQIRIQELEISNNRLLLLGMVVISVAVLVILVIIFRSLKQNQKHNKLLLEKNQIISDANIELDFLNKDLAEKNRDIELSNNLLKETNASKDKFFSIIAHDLKNPLTAIIMKSELSYKYFEKFSQQEQIENTKRLNQAAVGLAKLLENLLTWARSQTGVIKYEPEIIDLQSSIKETLQIFDESLNRKKINFKLEIPTGIFVFADLNMLKTIIRNLVSNAIKYTSDSGNIIIYGNQSDNNFYMISIRDDGEGISQSDADKLFDIKEKVSKPGTSGEKGTGLGLILCKEFVEKHGGIININSLEGEGSTFSFTLPCSKPE